MVLSRRGSLRWRMPLLISALLLTVLATFLWAAYRRVEATLVRAAGERAQAAADQVASLLNAEGSVEQIRQLSADPDLRRFLLQTRTDNAREAAYRRLLVLAGTGLRRVELWDATGVRLIEVSVPGRVGEDATLRELPPAQRPSVSGVGPIQGSGGIAFTDTVAEIRNEDSSAEPGSPSGLLGHVLVRSTFRENPPGIFGRLVGRDAVVRLGNRMDGIWTDLSNVVHEAPVDLGTAGVRQYRDQDGEMRLGAVSHVRGAPWAAWVEFPLATIVGPARVFLREIIPVALLFVAIGAALAGILSARITTPLSALSRASEAIASGDYSRRVAATRKDEIGRLGHAFNQMAEQIEGSQHRLEARVAERTAELTAARQVADRANQAKSEFLSRMSHELRTPLNAIMGFAQVLQLDSLNEEQRDSVTHILRGGRHLLLLINEVLDVARIEAGALSLSPEPVALADIVHHAVELIRPLAAQRNLTIQLQPLPNTSALADRQRFNQILFNLLSNAVKYNREHGTVRIFSPSTEPSCVAIVVADTGAGISPDKLALLFTPFERLGAEQSGIEGTGLGLALAKGLAEAMNGSLTVESVIDQGSAFRLELPATETGAVREETTPSRPLTDVGSAGTLVYIEDNLSNVKLMERVLTRRPGVQFLHAGDGGTGITLVRERRPNLVFLDLHLPDGPGEEVLRQLWENPATRTIPVVVLSADATPAQKRRLLASGATAYLTKPFDIGEMLQVIDRTLGRASPGEP